MINNEITLDFSIIFNRYYNRQKNAFKSVKQYLFDLFSMIIK